jgi:hypothetical protein
VIEKRVCGELTDIIVLRYAPVPGLHRFIQGPTGHFKFTT